MIARAMGKQDWQAEEFLVFIIAMNFRSCFHTRFWSSDNLFFRICMGIDELKQIDM